MNDQVKVYHSLSFGSLNLSNQVLVEYDRVEGEVHLGEVSQFRKLLLYFLLVFLGGVSFLLAVEFLEDRLLKSALGAVKMAQFIHIITRIS